MLPFNLLIKIAKNATLYKVDLDPEGLQSSQVKRTPQDSMNEFIIQKLNRLVEV